MILVTLAWRRTDAKEKCHGVAIPYLAYPALSEIWYTSKYVSTHSYCQPDVIVFQSPVYESRQMLPLKLNSYFIVVDLNWL